MILLTGATGKVGGELAKLVAAKGLAARALVRNHARAPLLRDLGIEVVFGDFGRPDTLVDALRGVERAFLLPPNGPAQVAESSAFIAAAKEAGVRHVVKVSGFLPDPESPNANARRHWETNEALKGSGLGWTLLRANFYMQNLLLFAREIGEHGSFGLNAGDAACGMVHVRDVAAVAAECLMDDAHVGQDHAVTGSSAITFAEVATVLSASAGRSVTYVAMADKMFRDRLLGQGLPQDTAAALTETYRGVAEGRFATLTDTVKRITGRPPIPIEQFASELARSLRGASGPDAG